MKNVVCPCVDRNVNFIKQFRQTIYYPPSPPHGRLEVLRNLHQAAAAETNAHATAHQVNKTESGAQMEAQHAFGVWLEAEGIIKS